MQTRTRQELTGRVRTVQAHNNFINVHAVPDPGVAEVFRGVGENVVGRLLLEVVKGDGECWGDRSECFTNDVKELVLELLRRGSLEQVLVTVVPRGVALYADRAGHARIQGSVA